MDVNLYEMDLSDPRAIAQVIILCGEMQRDISALRAEVATLAAMRDTLNAVFIIEAPAACPECNGEGKWTDSIGTVRLCKRCDGMGEVQS
jgi:hypothetical protein